MNASRAANASLGLVALGWLLAAWGVLSQMGDPSPLVPRSELEAHRHVSQAFLLVGFMFLLAGLWLSGYSFSLARKRATVALFACVAPLVVIFFVTFH